MRLEEFWEVIHTAFYRDFRASFHGWNLFAVSYGISNIRPPTTHTKGVKLLICMPVTPKTTVIPFGTNSLLISILKNYRLSFSPVLLFPMQVHTFLQMTTTQRSKISIRSSLWLCHCHWLWLLCIIRKGRDWVTEKGVEQTENETHFRVFFGDEYVLSTLSFKGSTFIASALRFYIAFK